MEWQKKRHSWNISGTSSSTLFASANPCTHRIKLQGSQAVRDKEQNSTRLAVYQGSDSHHLPDKPPASHHWGCKTTSKLMSGIFFSTAYTLPCCSSTTSSLFKPNSGIYFSTFCLFFFCSFTSPFRKMYFYPKRANCSSRDLMSRSSRQTHDLWVSSAPFISVETRTTAKCIDSPRILVSPWDKICSSRSKVQSFVNRLRFAFSISFLLYSSQLQSSSLEKYQIIHT